MTIFTKIANREIPGFFIKEDDNFFAILNINPVKPGHTLVIPKVEVEYIFDLDEELYKGLFAFAKGIAPALKKATDAKRICIEVMGFEIPHIHVHLIPLASEDEIKLGQKSATQEELKEMQEKILKFL
jgi:histidine triad (HIT) family protein